MTAAMADKFSGKIIEMKVMELEEDDITSKPDANLRHMHNITIPDRSVKASESPWIDDVELPNWITLSKSASNNIRNVRLVSRSFKQGSGWSFVKLLEQPALQH